MTAFILHEVLIQDTETKKIYTFTPCEYTVSEMNNELSELNSDEVDDIKNCNEIKNVLYYEGIVRELK